MSQTLQQKIEESLVKFRKREVCFCSTCEIMNHSASFHFLKQELEEFYKEVFALGKEEAVKEMKEKMTVLPIHYGNPLGAIMVYKKDVLSALDFKEKE